MPFTARNAKAEWSADGDTWTALPECRAWSIEPSTDNKPYASSSTSGRIRREPGNSDLTGSVDFFQDAAGTVEAIVQEGTKGKLRLYEAADRYHQADVIIDGYEYETDIEGAELIGFSVKFSGNGAYTRPV